MPERKKIVQNLVDYFRTNREVIATDITRMMGKPIIQSREEIDYSIERTLALLDLAEDALKTEYVSREGNISKSVVREPVSDYDSNQ